MFLDIAWSEIAVIGVVAIVAIGPKELPGVMRSLGRLVRRGQYLKFSMSRQFEEFMREHELDELRRSMHPQHDMRDTYFTDVNFEAARRNAQTVVPHEAEEAAADETLAAQVPKSDEIKGDPYA